MKNRLPLLCAALAVMLVLPFAAPLRAQEAAPESQDKNVVVESAPPAAPVALEAPTTSEGPTAPVAPAVTPAAPAAPQWIDRGEVVVFLNDVVIRENERASKVVVIGGDVDMRGRVDGELVAIGGDVKVDGPVGKLVAIGGDVTMGPKGRVGGEVVAVGGDFRNPDGVPIRGKTVAIGRFLPKLAPMLDWVAQGLSQARLLVPGLAWPWYVFGGGVLFLLLLAAIFGRSVNACSRVLEEEPGTTLVTAIALLPLLPLFILVLVLTGIGVLLLPFLAVAVLFALFFGKAAVMVFIGRSVLRPLGGGALAESAPLAVLVGAVALAVLYCIPWLGLLVWALATWIGFGMVVAAIRRHRQCERARRAAATPPASAASFAAAAPVTVGATPFVAAVPMAAGAAQVPVTAPAAESAAEMAGAVPPPVLPPSLVPPVLEAATLPRADFWLRLGALLVDIVLVAVAGGVSMVFALLPFPLLFGGYMFALWQWKGTTIGGIVFNLKVVRLDGRPVDPATALVRTLVAFLSAVTLVGFLWCLWDPETQTWHDKVAGTVVVRVPKGLSLV